MPKVDVFLLIHQACDSAANQQTTAEFAATLGLKQGITGYIYHTVPVVIQVWLKYPKNYPAAITEIIPLGGDTDTSAAILGGIIGASVGKTAIPEPWLDNLWEWPRTVEWIEALGERLAQVCDEEVTKPALPLSIFGVLLRNFFFILVLLLHGFRRLLPPY